MRWRAGTSTTRALPSARGKSKYWAVTPARSSCWAWPLTWVSSRSRACCSRRRFASMRRYPVAVLGLAVNVVSAWLLSTGAAGHAHHHEHHAGECPGHDHHPHHHDLNLRSAYLHVVADAATSVLAIVALVGGKYLGANWLDPMMGIAGTSSRWPVGTRLAARYGARAARCGNGRAGRRGGSRGRRVAAWWTRVAGPARLARGQRQVRLHREPGRERPAAGRKRASGFAACTRSSCTSRSKSNPPKSSAAFGGSSRRGPCEGPRTRRRARGP